MSDYVSLSDPRSMNGHIQSGGHWNAAFWMMTTGSGDVGTPQWSSRSVDGSANGILYIMESILQERGAASLGCATNRKRRAMGREPHLFLHFFLRFADFIAFARRQSAHNCTISKYLKR